MSSRIDSVEVILGEVEALLIEYHRQYAEPISLRALNQKFGKRMRALGAVLIEAIKADARFVVDMDRNAAYRVSLVETSNVASLVMHQLNRAGGRMPLEKLKANFDVLYRHKAGALDKILEHMRATGVLVLEGGVLELLVDPDAKL